MEEYRSIDCPSIIDKKSQYLILKLSEHGIFGSRIVTPENNNFHRVLEVLGHKFLIKFNSNCKITKISLLNSIKNGYLIFSNKFWGKKKADRIIEYILSVVGKKLQHDWNMKNERFFENLLGEVVFHGDPVKTLMTHVYEYEPDEFLGCLFDVHKDKYNLESKDFQKAKYKFIRDNKLNFIKKRDSYSDGELSADDFKKWLENSIKHYISK